MARRPRAPRPDPTDPFVLDLRDLGRSAGSRRELERTFAFDEPLDLDLVRIPAGAPIAAHLVAEAVVDGVLISGELETSYIAQCARCLTDLDGEVDGEVQELYAYPGPEPILDGDGEPLPLVVDDLVDLRELVRDTIVLALPTSPVCSIECPGLCPDCGERLADLPADHSHDALDPRWAALRGLVAGQNEEL